MPRVCTFAQVCKSDKRLSLIYISYDYVTADQSERVKSPYFDKVC